ncbi:flagellar biosynthesis protein FlhF [Azomonas agilis]|uniref:Flagellar biosynthesis protein FlhF n=1 Tax=Azomonas agilis TaxID=116849 RepID=A0A562I2R5_9GAMM|nr:flagellar biosynthesis protein FlhF [Azomonas agilis]TWH64943.1 flagellar biosynthesis protein FlhF [Azomonas agilis]
MQVKRFFAADMRQAMKLIRDQFGCDATIIGNRRVAGGIELTAALNYPMPSTRKARPNLALEAELRKSRATAQLGTSAQTLLSVAADVSDRFEKKLQLPDREKEPIPTAPETTVQPEQERRSQTPFEMEPNPSATASLDQRAFDAMRSELNGLRELLEVQLGSMAWGRVQNQQPNQAILWRRLQRLGLPADLSRDLLQKVERVEDSQQAWRLLLAHLAQTIKTLDDEPLEEGGIIALVGPAGVGKTTTLSKLAARYVLKYGSQNIALVTMDNFRIGAQEQLKTLGRILDVSVTAMGPDQSLPKVLASLADKRMILIDTAGLPVNDAGARAQLDALSDPTVGARNYLVLAATTQTQVLKAAWHSHKRCGLAGCIITKLDEAGSLGDLLGLAITQQLPIAYLTDGPRIPDDLHLPRNHRLVSRAVSLQAEDEPTEEIMADVFASLNGNSACRIG